MNSELQNSIDIATKISQIIPLALTVSSAPRPHHPTSLSLGVCIKGRYRIEDILGEGGMGTVYHVTDLIHPDRPVALKSLCGLAGASLELDLFKAEFQLMTGLHHPNIAAVYDFEPLDNEDDYFFTMERVRGQNILAATEGAGWEKIAELVVQLCRALSYVHSRGIIHFDIKPGNVLVDAKGVVKVLDFGVAGLNRLKTIPVLAGTSHYMAPELAQTNTFVDHRADLYSLGILFYQLLCRRLPFNGATFSDLIRQHRESPLEWVETDERGIPGWLQPIVEKLCAKNPAGRYLAANHVIEDLNRAGGFSYELETRKTKESYIFSSRFVGRAKEFEKITTFLEARLRGETEKPALLVSGESGIGKSRLLREIKYHSQLARTIFIEANCYEGRFDEYGAIGEWISYLIPLVEAAGHRRLIKDLGSELAKIEPHLARKYNLSPSLPLSKPEAERFRLQDQVCDFFLQVAEYMPFTLYINDLQWAPAGTAELIFQLIRRILLRERSGPRCRIALLGSFRSEEAEGRPLEALLARLREEPDPEIIELTALDAKSIEPFLGSMLGVESLPAPFLERVARETGGNPYFMEELMRVLVENGSVYIENGTWTAKTDIEDLEFPASISEVFLRRASLLTWQERLIVDLLAVGDRPTPLEILSKIIPFNAAALEGLLASLERKQIVRAGGEAQGEFHLSHDRIRETLYGAIEEERRKDLHRRFGQAIEEVFGEPSPTYLGALAHHYGRAQDTPKALHYSLAAGDDAGERYANDLAAAMYRQALSLLEPLDPRSRRIKEKLAEIHRMSGQYEDALKLVGELLDLAETREEKARLHRLMGVVLFERGNTTASLEELWQALGLMGEWRPRSRLAMGLALCGAFLEHLLHRCFPRLIRRAAHPEARISALEKCLTYGKISEAYWFCDMLGSYLTFFRSINCGEHAGDSRELCYVYCGAQNCYGMLTRYRTAEKYGIKAACLAERFDSVWHRGLVASYRGMVALYSGRWTRALENAREAKGFLEKSGDYFEISLPYLVGFSASFYLGRLEEAKQWAEEAIGICERTQVKGIGYFLAQHALIRAYLGETEAALAEAFQGIRRAEQDASDFLSLGFTKMAAGECLLAAEKAEEAISQFEEVKTLREEKKFSQDWFVGIYPLLARARIEKLHRENRAPDRKEWKALQRLARTGTRLSRRHPNFIVPSAIASGLVAWTGGRRNTARHLFARAVKVAADQGGMFHLAQANFEAGRAYLSGGRKDDTEAGRTHLLAAMEAFMACGSHPGFERCQKFLYEIEEK